MIQKLAETDCILLEGLFENSYSNQKELCMELGITETAGSRALSRLKKAKLIVVRKIGRYCNISINRNKKNEISKVLTIWKKVNKAILNKSQVLIRPHDFEIYVKGYIAKDYHREKYKRYYPKNRICVTREIKNLAKINISFEREISERHNIQIFIESFYLIVSLDIKYDELKELIYREIINRYNLIKELLEMEGVFLEGDYEISLGALAINDDNNTRLAIRKGIKIKDEVDESHYGIPESEFHGEDCIKNIWLIINLRKFCIENNIDEHKLSLIKDKILKEIELLESN